MPTNFIYIVLD